MCRSKRLLRGPQACMLRRCRGGPDEILPGPENDPLRQICIIESRGKATLRPLVLKPGAPGRVQTASGTVIFQRGKYRPVRTSQTIDFLCCRLSARKYRLRAGDRLV